MSTTKFHTHTKQQAELYFYISWSLNLIYGYHVYLFLKFWDSGHSQKEMVLDWHFDVGYMPVWSEVER